MLCLTKVPRNPSLWTPMPPICLWCHELVLWMYPLYLSHLIIVLSLHVALTYCFVLYLNTHNSKISLFTRGHINHLKIGHINHLPHYNHILDMTTLLTLKSQHWIHPKERHDSMNTNDEQQWSSWLIPYIYWDDTSAMKPLSTHILFTSRWYKWWLGIWWGPLKLTSFHNSHCLGWIRRYLFCEWGCWGMYLH